MQVMLGLKSEGKSVELFVAIENAMNDFTGIKFETIVDLETSQVIPYLKSQKTLNKEHWIIIGDLMMLAGEMEIEKKNLDLGISHLTKSLEIARFIDEIETKIFSIQHNNKLLQLQERLKQLSF